MSELSKKYQEIISELDNRISDENELEYNKSYIGKEVEVLFEEKDGEFFKGHTKNYMVVQLKTNENLENTIKVVKIVDANEEYLRAE